jgi:hypothetical protein
VIELIGDRTFRVNYDTRVISVSIAQDRLRGTVGLDLVFESEFTGPAHWWVNRAVVHPAEQRGKGLGSIMLKRALEQVVLSDIHRVLVMPGGYDNNTERQFNFYLKNGFKRTDEPESLVWQPNDSPGQLTSTK